MLMKTIDFSVLISVYYKENPIFFKQSIDSLLNQTILPNEIVLVKDGPLTEDLEDVIGFFCKTYKNLFKIISLEENKGLGYALSVGILQCSNDIVARMDTDDLCLATRFQKQINFLLNNNHIDVVGSNIEEFNSVPGDLKRIRKMPEDFYSIKKYSRFRNPINHPSVMYKKSKVIEAGNYNDNILFFEDYSLFVRMLKNGSKFHNIQESLLNFRVGTGIDMIKRRSGFNYLKEEWKFSLLSLRIGHINFLEWLFYIFTKLPFRLLPPRVVLFVYNKFLRN